MNNLVGKVYDSNIISKMAKMFDDGGYCYTESVLTEYFSKWLNVPKSTFINYTSCFEPWFMIGDEKYNLGEIYKSDDIHPKYFFVFKVADAFAFTIKFEHISTVSHEYEMHFR